MKILRSDNFTAFATIFLLGCVSSAYKIDRHDEGRTQIVVTRDRILLECYRLTDYTGHIKEAHLFSMNVLDENNTVLTVSQGNILSEEDCQGKISKIGRILKSGKQIFIGGMGNLNGPREPSQRLHSFPALGRFPENGRSLQFMTIWNEKGMCYNAYSGYRKPCPSDEFPIAP